MCDAVENLWTDVNKGVEQLARPVAQVASVIPGPWQPFAQGALAVDAARHGNIVGAGLNALGAYGSSGLGAASSVPSLDSPFGTSMLPADQLPSIMGEGATDFSSGWGDLVGSASASAPSLGSLSDIGSWANPTDGGGFYPTQPDYSGTGTTPYNADAYSASPTPSYGDPSTYGKAPGMFQAGGGMTTPDALPPSSNDFSLGGLFDKVKGGIEKLNQPLYKGGMSGMKAAGGLYDMWAKNQMANQMQNTYNQNQAATNGMGLPGTPEYEAMRQTLARQDARAGRNSQYGPRAVDLAARMAELRSKASGAQQSNQNTLQQSILANRYGGLNSLFAFGSQPAAKAAVLGGR